MDNCCNYYVNKQKKTKKSKQIRFKMNQIPIKMKLLDS